MKSLTLSNFYKILTAAIILSACRGMPSNKTPFHFNPNMDESEAFQAQEKNYFFEDGRAMRPLTEGTIARGHLIENTALQLGKDEKGNFVKNIPLNVTKAFIEHGAEEYRIFCTPCHGGVGDGKGMIVSYGFVPPPSYHEERLREVEDGYLFDVITNGVRSMFPYKSQIPKVEDRWAIVSYIRALQQSQHSTKTDLGSYQLTEADLNRHKDAELAAQQAKEKAAQALASMSVDELVNMGKALFASKTCSTCHSIDGNRIVGPTMKGLFGHEVEFSDGSKTKVDEAYIVESIKNPNAKIVKDYPAAMPSFSDLLTDVEIQALVEYIKTVK